MKKNEISSYIVIVISIVCMFYFLEPVELTNNTNMKTKFLSSGINM